MAEFIGFVVGVIRAIANIIVVCAAFKYLFLEEGNENNHSR